VATMKLVITTPVMIALRTVSDEERRRAQALLDTLANWNHDAHVRDASRRIIHKDVYVLQASDGMRIFFKKDPDQITILDIARKQTVDQFAEAE
jgi:mRNA-degrading endonuclease RelE of RelBE toxin-antitoxin system